MGRSDSRLPHFSFQNQTERATALNAELNIKDKHLSFKYKIQKGGKSNETSNFYKITDNFYAA